MHVLFVHQNFPAQFGPIAFELAKRPGWRCTFVSEKLDGVHRGVTGIKYQTQGGARATTHYCSRTFENAVWHTSAIHDTLKARPEIRPDLIVGHSGFGSTLFLRELYPGVPIINLFEYFYRPRNSDMDFRPEFPSLPEDLLRAQARNAMILLDLDNCAAGYCPTAWQRSRFPTEYHGKLQTLFDGVDTTLWKRDATVDRRIAGRELPRDRRIVSYVSRGFESMRGFDIFMKVAHKLNQKRDDLLFVVVGSDRVCYGGDLRFTGGQSFRDWVLKQDEYDLSRFWFTGPVPEAELARLFSLTDLHIYLTVPFVLSWSLFNALACGAVVLGSNTGPVREIIHPGETGLIAAFYDVEGFVEQALAVLAEPERYRPLGEAGERLIQERYSLDVCLPRFLELFERVRRGSSG